LKLKGRLEWLLDEELVTPPEVDILHQIEECTDQFESSPTKVVYPASELFRVKTSEDKKANVKSRPRPIPGKASRSKCR
jgi:hypothetical protein